MRIFEEEREPMARQTVPARRGLRFREKVRAARLGPVVSHASYLIDSRDHESGAPTGNRWTQWPTNSIALKRSACSAWFCIRAAAQMATKQKGLVTIKASLLKLLRARRRGKTMVLLEHLAGQGTALGATFEQLASIIAKMDDHRRVGVCLDDPPSPGVRLRHLLTGRLCIDVQAVRTAGRV